MKSALEPIGRTIILSPSARATPTGLEYLREPTSDELDSDDYTIQRCEGSVSWWMGDLICKRIDLALANERRARNTSGVPLTPEDRHGYISEYAREYAKTRGLAEGTVLARAKVGGYFPIVSRHTGLTWGHHWEIYSALSGKGLPTCKQWLDRAYASQWSVAQLRAELRLAAHAPSASSLPSISLPDELVTVERWSSTQWTNLKRTPKEQAAWLLDQMPMTVKVIEHLKRVAFPDSDRSDLKRNGNA